MEPDSTISKNLYSQHAYFTIVINGTYNANDIAWAIV